MIGAVIEFLLEIVLSRLSEVLYTILIFTMVWDLRGPLMDLIRAIIYHTYIGKC